MKSAPQHTAQVFKSPWDGVFTTCVESDRHYGKHSHATYGFGILESGGQSSLSGKGSVDAYAGDIITVNPGEVHDGRPIGGAARRWRMVYAEPEVMMQWALDSGKKTKDIELTQPVFQNAPLSAVLRRLLGCLQQWNGATGISPLACEEALVETCALLTELPHNSEPAALSAGANKGTASAGIVRARDRLADDVSCSITLTELAHEADLSKFQLLRHFQKSYGLPPHTWLLQQRAEKARNLIKQGTSLVQTAADTGFADQSHMTRIFARQFGFTPGAWRSACA
jgi:AraC-like DNA-binding protein